MTEGKVPYTDLFDHKGLLLYAINAIGYMISVNFGVMLLQIVHLTLTLIVWYKMWAIIKEKWIKYLLLVFMLMCLYPFYANGNMTEEWSLLLNSYPLMLYVVNIQNGRKEFSSLQLFEIGLCAGGMALIRVNNMAPLVGLILYCFIIACLNRNFKYILRAFLFMSCGFAFPVLLAVAYMGIVGGMQGIKDMYYANITFNLEYSHHDFLWMNPTIKNVKFVYKSIIIAFFVLPFVKKAPKIALPCLLGFVVTFLSIGGKGHQHYLMIFVPLIAFAIASMSNARIRYAAVLLIVALTCKTLYKQGMPNTNYNEGNTYLECFEKVIKPIPESERDNIWNFNGAFILNDFCRAGCNQQNRMILGFQLSLSDSLYKSESEKIQRVRPKYVIYTSGYKEEWMASAAEYSRKNNNAEYERDKSFLFSNYEKVSSANWKDGTEVACYKQKEQLE